jgi:tetratricopeptide (TPR) repeat protein
VHAGADDAFALAALGAAHTLAREFDRAEELLSRAVANEPNCGWGWNRLGWLNGYRGRSNESIECFERALRLSPLDPINFNCWVGIGAAHFLEGRSDDAIRWMEKATAASPGARWIWRQIVPAYVEAGRDDDARRGLALLLEDCPGLTCEGVRAAMLYAEPVMRRLCAGLAHAGLPLR